MFFIVDHNLDVSLIWQRLWQRLRNKDNVNIK